MKKIILGCTLMLTVCLISACKSNVQRSIEPIDHVIIPTNVSKGGENAIKKCIINGAKKRKWTCAESGPRKLICENISRNHKVQVSIDYTPIEYSINYIDSINMQADGNMIHYKYNKWVQKLNADIREEMIKKCN